MLVSKGWIEFPERTVVTVHGTKAQLQKSTVFVEPAWSVDDGDGHGTGMAGLAAYGDLAELLESANEAG